MWGDFLIIGSISLPVIYVGLFNLGRWSSRVRINNNIKEMEDRKDDFTALINEQKEALDLLDSICYF